MTRREAVNRRRGVLLLAPTVLALGTLTVYPGVWVLWLSLQHRIPIFGVSRFAGLDNYAFLAVDSRFSSAAATTIIFTVTSVALEVALGVAAALAIHAQRGGRRVALSLLLLAWAMPAVVTAKLFEWLYHPTAGLLNVALGGGHALNWLGDPRLALPAVVLADVWRTMPFVAVLCYARLLAIPAELYEAAQVDGAGRLATLVLITLPMLSRILLVAILFRTLDALRAFDLMFVLTGGGPAGTTETITVYAYRALFQTLQLGFGSALSVVVFVLVMAVAWAYLRLLRTSMVTA
jgi:multiple sugar transport system permease protein